MDIKNNVLDTGGLYRIQQSDIKKCALSLALSFSEDKAMRRFIGGNDFDEEKLYNVFLFIVRASLRNGHVYAISKDMEGVIIWLPENITKLGTRDFFTSGGIRIILKYGFKIPLTMMKYEDFTSSRHNYHIKKPHWYLLALSVKKEYRGQGLSSQLIKPFLEFFDKMGISCYLETGAGNNEAMYRHYGFDLLESTLMPGTDLVFKAMLRNAKKAEGKFSD